MKINWIEVNGVYYSQPAVGSRQGRFQIFKAGTRWHIRDMQFAGIVFADTDNLQKAKAIAEKRLIRKHK